MKCNPETMSDYLDNLGKTGTRAGAARGTGLDAMTPWRWSQASIRAAAVAPDEPSIYRFTYRDVDGWFHEHAKAVVKAQIVAIQNAALDRALNGSTTVAMVNGQIVYALNPDFEETSETRKIETDRDLVMLGYEPRYLRDENFKKVPSLIHSAPSNDLTVSVLASFSKRWSKKVAISHEHSHSGRVMITSKAALPRGDLPMLQIIEQPVAEQVADMSGVLEPGSEEQQEQMAEPAPAALIAPPPRTSISPLQRELIDRARAKGLSV